MFAVVRRVVVVSGKERRAPVPCKALHQPPRHSRRGTTLRSAEELRRARRAAAARRPDDDGAVRGRRGVIFERRRLRRAAAAARPEDNRAARLDRRRRRPRARRDTWQSGCVHSVSQRRDSGAMQQSSSAVPLFAAHMSRRITRPNDVPPHLGMWTKCEIVQRRCGCLTTTSPPGRGGQWSDSSQSITCAPAMVKTMMQRNVPWKVNPPGSEHHLRRGRHIMSCDEQQNMPCNGMCNMTWNGMCNGTVQSIHHLRRRSRTLFTSAARRSQDTARSAGKETRRNAARDDVPPKLPPCRRAARTPRASVRRRPPSFPPWPRGARPRGRRTRRERTLGRRVRRARGVWR